MDNQAKHKMNKCAFGLSLGVIWGLSVFFMAILAKCCGYGDGFVEGLGELYLGYDASILGALVGALWGFVDAFVFGFLAAWLYNFFSCCCKCPMKSKEDA